jgi:AMMECR1 domain-containing protein
MRWIAAVIALSMLPVSLRAQAPARPPKQPTRPVLPAQSGSHLTTQARSAMLKYLASRKTARQQAISENLQTPVVTADGSEKPLAELPYAAIVTLRQDGRVVASALGEGHDLARNIIAAALQAMRSPRLPDRITSSVLLELTLEVSVLGDPVEVKDDQLADAIEPGIVGLRLTRGMHDPGLRVEGVEALLDTTYILPSRAYVLGWSAEQMKRHCLRTMDQNPLASGLPGAWHAFAALHFVDYPGSDGTWGLYRGKLLSPIETLNEQSFQNHAQRIVGWLIRHLDEQGQLDVAQANLAEQCYAAWALARYSSLRETPQAQVAAEAILGYVAEHFVRADAQADQAHVVTPKADGQARATAMFLLASGALPQNEQTQAVRRQLARWLSSKLDALSEPQRSGDLARVLLALYRADLPDFRPPAKTLDGLLLRLGAGEPGQPPNAALLQTTDVDTLVWTCRALLAAKPHNAAYVKKLGAMVGVIGASQHLIAGPLDEFGGYGRPKPATPTTGAAVAMLGESAAALADDPQASKEMLENLAGPMDDARRFCCRMTYRPSEAFFVAPAKRPDWNGAVRRVPHSSLPSVEAAAAALEAFLAPATPAER